MFGRIARRYDLANHLLSAGMDFIWRARATSLVKQWRPNRILDLATGSGDLALAMQRRLPTAAITAADFSPEMIRVAQDKGVRNALVADALSLPFEDGAFDVVTVAFGLRNMSDWTAALGEMRRVLAANGHLLVLDFSIPPSPLRAPYRFYLHHLLPRAAASITGEKEAYEYLAGSIEAFPSGAAMVELIGSSGFSPARVTPMTGGIATIYTAERIG